MRKKVLLAIAFAGGLLNWQMPAISKENADSTDSVIEQLANNTQAAPEVRAFYLLKIASSYLAGGTKSTVDAQFGNVMKTPVRIFGHFGHIERGDNILVSWAEQVSLEGHHLIKLNSKPTTDAQSIADEESRALANRATLEALTLLDKASGTYAKLEMYFIASRFFQNLVNTDGMRKCDKVLDEAFRACEEKSPIDEEQVRAASSILNSMAYGYVPVHIPDLNPYQLQQTQKPFAEEDFRKSEKLKLRAVAMTDRLAATADVRRKAHRDLALWYIQLGRVEMAEKEKQVLFELVGSKDDSILYPQRGACGSLIWWQTEKIVNNMDCGMG